MLEWYKLLSINAYMLIDEGYEHVYLSVSRRIFHACIV